LQVGSEGSWVRLPDKPVDVLYAEMGDSAMIFQVRWWIESCEDTRRMFDRVHRPLQRAINEAGIESPNPTQKISLEVEAGTANHPLEAFGGTCPVWPGS